MSIVKRLDYPFIPARYYSQRGDTPIDTIVIHYTAGRGDERALARFFASGERQASAHFGIGRQGGVVQMVDLDMMAWHAGESSLDGVRGVGRRSIGIELCNSGWAYTDRLPQERLFVGSHRNPTSTSKRWEMFTGKQIDALKVLIDKLHDNICTLRFVVGHDDIRNIWTVDIRGSKLDPGPAFPWRDLSLESRGLVQRHFSFKTKQWYTTPDGQDPVD